MDKIPKASRTVTLHILSAAKLNIVKKWNTNMSPSFNEVVQDLNLFCAYENIFALKNLSLPRFLVKWDLWLKYPYCIIITF